MELQIKFADFLNIIGESPEKVKNWQEKLGKRDIPRKRVEQADTAIKTNFKSLFGVDFGDVEAHIDT